MKPCPFCGTPSDGLRLGLLRIICLTCGTSGPVSENPPLAWNSRISGKNRILSDDEEIASLHFQLQADLEDDEIRVDGSIESVRYALQRIFYQCKRT